MAINLVVELEEANDILNVLGQLPTASNAWPLMQRLRGQIEAQVSQPEEAPKED
jgi:hypothetical protein